MGNYHIPPLALPPDEEVPVESPPEPEPDVAPPCLPASWGSTLPWANSGGGVSWDAGREEGGERTACADALIGGAVLLEAIVLWLMLGSWLCVCGGGGGGADQRACMCRT